ncbi:MAG: D-hexose-6-phosphate mutarotase [Gammaproteobacteria bacterium]|nr:D-hexose-6-phosphate mutarotase [Gammaproteobacteria bacterium]
MSIMSVSALNARFALGDALQFRHGPGGLIFAHIDNGFATARVCLQGAQLLDWQPAGEKPVIWRSNAARYETGVAIRGGVPVCWPWFGAHPHRCDAPAHGIARTALWQVIHSEALVDGRTRINFELPCPRDNPFWPEGAQLQLSLTVGRTLEMALVTENNGPQAITITQALHSYFVIGDIRQTRVLGLENGEYIDKLDDGRCKQQSGAILFDQEIDRIYHSPGTPCTIDDPGLHRQIHIRAVNSGSTVVWNPWRQKSAAMGDMDDDAYLGMLCVETANVAHNEIVINVGQSHRQWSKLAVR